MAKVPGFDMLPVLNLLWAMAAITLSVSVSIAVCLLHAVSGLSCEYD